MKNVKNDVVYLHLLWYNMMGSVLLVSVILELIDIRPWQDEKDLDESC